MPPESARALVSYRSPWLVVVAIALGSIAVLASSMGLINLLMPRMMAELGADVRTIQWVQTAFLLTMVVLMPAVGWMGAAFGQRRLYLGSLVLFTFGTLLCTLAWNMPSMIVFRVIQGIGAGLSFPLGTPFIFDAFPPQRRGVVLGVRTLISTTGSLGGTLLAAHLADMFGWRWGFYYLLFYCVIGLTVAALVLRERPLPGPGRFDLAGCLTLAVGMISLVLLITRRDGGPLLSGPTLGLGAAFLLSTAAFFLIESRISSPFVDLKIYRYAAYAAGSFLGFFLPATSVAVTFLLPIYMQKLLGYSIFQTALIRLPMSITMTAVTPLSGWLSDRVDTRLIVGGGLLGYVLSVYSLSGLSLYTSAFTLAFILTTMGISSACIFIPMSNVMFSALPHESVRLGSGLYALNRQLGRSIGTAAISVIFADRLTARFVSLSEGVVPTSPALRFNLDRLSGALRDLGILHPDAGARQMLYDRLQEEASVAAFTDCYFMVAIFLLLSLIPVYFMRNRATDGGEDGGR